MALLVSLKTSGNILVCNRRCVSCLQIVSQNYNLQFGLWWASYCSILAHERARWDDITNKNEFFWKFKLVNSYTIPCYDYLCFTGRFLEFVSVIVFVVLLILMAKGYTITRGRIRKIGVIKIIVFSVIYCLITVAMFIWEATVSYCLIWF